MFSKAVPLSRNIQKNGICVIFMIFWTIKTGIMEKVWIKFHTFFA